MAGAEGIEGQATVHVHAPPEKLYALITDVSRMGEWSPETVKAEWLDGATEAKVGARFKGSNKKGLVRWSTKPTVTVADPGREFTFEVGKPDRPDTRWSFRMAAKDGGTDLTESFEALRYSWFFKIVDPPKRRVVELQRGIEQTLACIKAAAEGSA